MKKLKQILTELEKGEIETDDFGSTKSGNKLSLDFFDLNLNAYDKFKNFTQIINTLGRLSALCNSVKNFEFFYNYMQRESSDFQSIQVNHYGFSKLCKIFNVTIKRTLLILFLSIKIGKIIFF